MLSMMIPLNPMLILHAEMFAKPFLLLDEVPPIRFSSNSTIRVYDAGQILKYTSFFKRHTTSYLFKTSSTSYLSSHKWIQEIPLILHHLIQPGVTLGCHSDITLGHSVDNGDSKTEFTAWRAVEHSFWWNHVEELDSGVTGVWPLTWWASILEKWQPVLSMFGRVICPLVVSLEGHRHYIFWSKSTQQQTNHLQICVLVTAMCSVNINWILQCGIHICAKQIHLKDHHPIYVPRVLMPG